MVEHARIVGPPLKVKEAEIAEGGGHVHAEPKSHSFCEMAKDFEFFTTALITSHGKFDRDPLVEFVKMFPESNDQQPFSIDYQASPLFTGIGRHVLPGGELVNWDHRLYAIVRDRWILCRDFVLGIAWMDTARRTYTRVNCYELELLDPIAVKRGMPSVKPPTFPVTVFGVSSTHHFTYLQPAAAPYGLPYLREDPPKESLQQEGFAALGPPPDPERLISHIQKESHHAPEASPPAHDGTEEGHGRPGERQH